MKGASVRVRGLVQGVGFRPYVWRLATELGLCGWVCNDSQGVLMAVAGARLDEFLTRLPRQAPRLARIDGVEVSAVEVDAADFAIKQSRFGAVGTAIGPDAAICPDCIADLCDPQGRRWRYALTTCTHCGPRYTVSWRIPYDRAQTSLAPFALCPTCRAEYDSPVDRRFHAETTCCPTCGPTLQLLEGTGRVVEGDSMKGTLERLQAGAVIAIKGLGGFHLVCDARNAAAVATLRQRKHRETKPLAVMALNVASLEGVVHIGPAAAALLESPEAPIVLCPKAPNELEGVAPGLAHLGVMLPCTPIQLLLWHEAQGRPAGTAWTRQPSEMLLVMSSANPQGEPLVIDNTEAQVRLAGMADGFLLHNRDIVVRCDDSVRGASLGFIRRARGYTPLPVALVHDGPVVLALGAHLKNTLCVARGREAFLSQHIGGLDNVSAIGFLQEMMTHLPGILEAVPELIVHDLHPDYASTRLAQQLAAQRGVPTLAVAHHHAHIAAVCAEHQCEVPVLGLALDGVGLGPDGGLWGGELLRVHGAHCERLGHLRPLRLPGGERAAREPWRMAVSALVDAGCAEQATSWLRQRYPEREIGPLRAMIERGLNAPATSSMGRLFDAAAGLLGVRAISHYEGQAAMELEALALRHGGVKPLDGGTLITGQVLDSRALLLRLAQCDDAGYGAALFHATMAAGLVQWVKQAAQREALDTVVIAGGCAMNTVLMAAVEQALETSGLRLLQARQVPPNDGGLALGQAWIARHRLAKNQG